MAALCAEIFAAVKEAKDDRTLIVLERLGRTPLATAV